MTQVVDFRIGEQLRENSAVLDVDVGEHGVQVQRVLVDATVAEKFRFDPLLFHEDTRRLLGEEDVFTGRGAEVERIVHQQFIEDELSLVESFEPHLIDEGHNHVEFGRREADFQMPRLRVVECVEQVKCGGFLLEQSTFEQDHLHDGEELTHELGQFAVRLPAAEDLLEVQAAPLADEVAECQVGGGYVHDQLHAVVLAALRNRHAHHFGGVFTVFLFILVHAASFSSSQSLSNCQQFTISSQLVHNESTMSPQRVYD